MFQGYNLNLQQNTTFFDDYYETGKRLYKNQEDRVIKKLEYFKDLSDDLKAEDIIKEWFPEIEADIFLSHSHQDEELVISLAGWLKKKFGLVSFIDSTVWGYADKLLEEIDMAYCALPTGCFDYKMRNYSTAHVHMMLSSALMTMMDKCECVFFVNTPQSFTPVDELQNGKTKSPWIFFEISLSRIIRKPLRRKASNFLFPTTDRLSQESINEYLSIDYRLSLKHFKDITLFTLWKWNIKRHSQHYSVLRDPSIHALDVLYHIVDNEN